MSIYTVTVYHIGGDNDGEIYCQFSSENQNAAEIIALIWAPCFQDKLLTRNYAFGYEY